MRDELLLKKIAVIRTDFPEKFGIPRQSGLADAEGRIVFEPEYRNPDALRGIEAYSHLWIIWGFSQVPEREGQPMGRPPRLCVRGVDMLDGTPVYDIKPYLPYVEAREGAADGFAGRVKDRRLLVEIPDEQLRMVPQDKRRILEELLMQDPRPAYQVDPDRVYGMTYAGMEIKFQVRGDRLKVCGIYEKVH